MSIAEFLDGLPSYDVRNFSNFNSKTSRSKPKPIYIRTNDKPSKQIIVNDASITTLDYLHKQWDVKNGFKKSALIETSEEFGPTSRKQPRIDIDIIL